MISRSTSSYLHCSCVPPGAVSHSAATVVQFASSLPSWQSFSMSHRHLELTHWPLEQRNSVPGRQVVLGQSASSLPSPQSLSKSHFQYSGTHLPEGGIKKVQTPHYPPFPHMNWLSLQASVLHLVSSLLSPQSDTPSHRHSYTSTRYYYVGSSQTSI